MASILDRASGFQTFWIRENRTYACNLHSVCTILCDMPLVEDTFEKTMEFYSLAGFLLHHRLAVVKTHYTPPKRFLGLSVLVRRVQAGNASRSERVRRRKQLFYLVDIFLKSVFVFLAP